MGAKQPQLRQAQQGGFEMDGGQRHVQIGRQALLRHAHLQRRVDVLLPHVEVAGHHGDDGGVFFGVLALEVQHAAEFAVGLVALQALEAVEKRLPQALQHVGGIADVGLQLVADHIEDAGEQRIKQIFLVLEVPVERAARDAGGLRDFVQRGARDAALVENVQRGLHEAFARFLRLGFGSTHG